MSDSMIEIVFGIIAAAGDAKGMAKDAIKAAKKKEYMLADELLEEASKKICEAHKFQTDLLVCEANGDRVETSVMLIHSQDHLMTSINYIDLAEEFVELYKQKN